MTNIKALRPYSNRVTLSLSAALALFALPSCNSLWSGFAIDDPNSCAAMNTVNPCNDQQRCNPATGMCDPAVTPPPTTLDPLRYSDLNPKSTPASGGGSVVVTGQGFTRNTIFSIAGQPLKNPTYLDSSRLTGTIPRSPNRCGLVDISLSREDGASIQKPAQLRYTLNPLMVRSSQLGYTATYPISQIQSANLDNDTNNTQELLFTHSKGFAVQSQTKSSDFQIPTGIGERVAITKLPSNLPPEITLFNKSTSQLESYALNKTTSTYMISRYINISGIVNDIIPVDTNRDGTDELLLSISNSPGNSTLALYSRNPTLPKFDALSSIPFTADLGPILIGDFDGNGQPDAVATTDTKWRVYTMNPTTGSIGTFQISDPGFVVKSMTAGDFNGDGKSDLALYNVADGNLHILSYNGSMLVLAKTLSIGLPPSGFPAPTMQTYDINCDGLTDIVINQPTMNGNDYKLIFNNGGFSFTQPSSTPNAFMLGGPFLIADTNQDSLPEVFSIASTSQNNVVAMEAYIP